MLAPATAHASGLPMNVGPCISTPDSDSLIRWATSRVQMTAASVR